MDGSIRLTFKKGDWLAIALVVLIALSTAAAFLPDRSEAGSVQIYQDGRLIDELSLAKDETVVVGGNYTNTVVVRNGCVSIAASTCPGRDCVHSGWISSAGRSIVCLPNRIEVRIVGKSEVDFIVG